MKGMSQPIRNTSRWANADGGILAVLGVCCREYNRIIECLTLDLNILAPTTVMSKDIRMMVKLQPDVAAAPVVLYTPQATAHR